MDDIHPTMTRLYTVFEEKSKAANPRARVGQSALARKLNTSPQVVKNWESRGISQRGAQKAQATLGVNSTWVLHGTGPVFVGLNPPPLSHPTTPDPDILRTAVSFLLFDLDHGGPRTADSASDLLMDLYQRIEANGGRLPKDESLAFELAARARGKQGDAVHGDVQGSKRGKR